ncbi:TetR family transcriptional regulator [Kineosporia sp. J2-2]|uniref:TetR family transcriptional regulator n=1 Tax=Kineosporia corallincola TaxID=2835133 RepID=A0ABS5TMK6_9ACTN|nr:TetR family transcriptional regulator [Kineosporia corallincola]MBT0772337.1 TetR family transcriptional regulator [Kineosporia corallincola]
MAARRSATRERLSREAIVTSALALAGAEGLDAVTVRRLAADHGVTPMALYWHFKDKDALLDGMVEQVLAGIEIPVWPAGEPPPWHSRIRACFEAILDGLGRHPEVADLVHQRFLVCRAGLDLAELVFAALREGGFSDEQMSDIGVYALHTLVMLVTQEPGKRSPRHSPEEAARSIRVRRIELEALEPDRYPSIIHCAPSLVAKSKNRRYQNTGLAILIEGIHDLQAKLPGGRAETSSGPAGPG